MHTVLTEHAKRRIRQRGLREEDVDVVLEHGTATVDAVLLTSQDVDLNIADYRRRISQLERLRGTAVFVNGDTVLSKIPA